MLKKPLRKMILVDDDPDVLTVCKYCLEDMKDVEIKFLSSGKEAIKEALVFQPDLIILDVMMPEMDGITTLYTLRQQPTLANVPVIFITAKLQQSEIESYFNLGIVDLIKKPFDPLTLSSIIQAIWNKCQM